ncbi:type III secretion system (T3SS) SseB-like protein [Georgenia soli]|uniref:Type III secretion system (T3SS) SseB-like protein n=1 Tax=Georgenia soli TaxID=638953 RepID=A0A2A9ELH0_9MICO|nr:SseB family protein [Georgenia soli]PFG39112.1 type III secretion system (T3SS) SseB-like protein [Georgenia soli]
MTQIPPMLRQQEAASAVGRWATSQVAPGWDALEVHLTARGQRWDVGVVDRRGGAEHGRWVIPVEPGTPLHADATVLRESAYRHPAGTWFSAVVTLTATGWPDARVSLATTLNDDDEPVYLLPDQPRVTAEDLLEDWVRFPRTREATPGWVIDRVDAAGLRLPFVPSESSGVTAPGLVPASAADVPTARTVTGSVPTHGSTSAPAATLTGPPDHASSPGPTLVPPAPHSGGVATPLSPDVATPLSPDVATPLSPDVATPLSPDVATPHSPDEASPGKAPAVPGLRKRPAELRLLIDRDGIPLSGGRRPQQRRGTVDGRATWRDILTSAGAPLTFVDGTGTWVALSRAATGEDVVVGVVTQTALRPDGSAETEVHVVTDALPWQLADADAALTVHFVSAPGPVEEVLAAAREGQVFAPAARRGSSPDNLPLRAALVEHALRGDSRSLRGVLAQALGGSLVLDASGSRLDASPPQVVVSHVTSPDGATGLAVFTRNAEVQQFRGDQPEGIFTLVQSAAATLEGAVGDPAVSFVVVDPAGASAVLPADLVRAVLAEGHNQAVKDLLAAGVRERAADSPEGAGTTAAPGWDQEPPSMQALLDALRTDEGFLFIAEREVDGRLEPVWLEGPDGRTLLAFTSAVEAALHGDEPVATPGFRRLPVGWILEFLLQSRGDALRINAAGPSVDLGVAQVRHLLANPVTD